ncbi:uncharacterized protein isoform X2 [Rhodnius prolixus]|uniref:uncharacterized protein isoform X2 n=1 Tax=Rhodnius prolixus TaxID=13249 RepID=UPI003D18C802
MTLIKSILENKEVKEIYLPLSLSRTVLQCFHPWSFPALDQLGHSNAHLSSEMITSTVPSLHAFRFSSILLRNIKKSSIATYLHLWNCCSD